MARQPKQEEPKEAPQDTRENDKTAEPGTIAESVMQHRAKLAEMDKKRGF